MEKSNLVTEFSRLLDRYEAVDDGTRQVLIGIVERLLDEEHWYTLDDEPLLKLLFEGISLYGQTNWEPLVQVVAPVYMHAMENVATDGRRDLQSAVRQAIESKETSVNALLPFLFLETEKGVVATAAIDFAMIPMPPPEDPLGWPRRLVSDVETGIGANKGAILGGLLVLGDRRVNEMLHEVKWLLSDEEIGVAAQSLSGMPTVAAFEFWLDWAEELAAAGLDNSALFGQVASGLLLLVNTARAETFHEITRNFGYLNLTDGPNQAMEVHDEYTRHQIGDKYATRLYALEAVESPPKLMSDVIRHLGREPAAAADQQFTTH